MSKSDLSKIPSMESILNSHEIQQLCVKYPRNLIKTAINDILSDIRNEPPADLICTITPAYFANRFEQFISRIKLGKVLNGTGVILHTNLGRSPLPLSSLNNIKEVTQNYVNLEYDFEHKSRGNRQEYLEYLLVKLTGAQAAFVVNNNAGAVFLVLSALFKNREVVVSRGELVEIGGSFRIPEIMNLSGAKLVEVGTTNIVRINDYEKVINENTASIMKVHPSNFSLRGFTAKPELREITDLGKKYNLITVEDLGSGLLSRFEIPCLKNEPIIEDSIKAGFDLVMFSGDKLLAGPQCGIIIGKKHLVDRIKKYPLSRTLRIDKITIAALEAVLELYYDEKKLLSESPMFTMLSTDISTLTNRAKNIISKIDNNRHWEVAEGISTTGGGSLPDIGIPSIRIVYANNKQKAETIFEIFKNLLPPLIGIVENDRYSIDLRTILVNDDNLLISIINQISQRES